MDVNNRQVYDPLPPYKLLKLEDGGQYVKVVALRLISQRWQEKPIVTVRNN